MRLGTAGGATGSKPTAPETPSFVISDTPSEPVEKLEQCSILIYGERKIGKTSLAAEFELPFFCMFEPGGSGLRIRQESCPDWQTFLGWKNAILKTLSVKTVVIDTIAEAYDRAMEYVCRQEGIDHPNEVNDFGATWKKIDRTFRQPMNEIVMSGRGIVFIGHADEKEFKDGRVGLNYTKIVPMVGKQARAYLTGAVDIIGYYGYYGDDRYLTLSGSDSLDAGQRLKEKFWVAGKVKEERVHSVPMGKNEEEAYANLVKAFNNLQETNGKPEDSTGLSEAPAEKKGKRR